MHRVHRVHVLSNKSVHSLQDSYQGIYSTCLGVANYKVYLDSAEILVVQ